MQWIKNEFIAPGPAGVDGAIWLCGRAFAMGSSDSSLSAMTVRSSYYESKKPSPWSSLAVVQETSSCLVIFTTSCCLHACSSDVLWFPAAFRWHLNSRFQSKFLGFFKKRLFPVHAKGLCSSHSSLSRSYSWPIGGQDQLSCSFSKRGLEGSTLLAPSLSLHGICPRCWGLWRALHLSRYSPLTFISWLLRLLCY